MDEKLQAKQIQNNVSNEVNQENLIKQIGLHTQKEERKETWSKYANCLMNLNVYNMRPTFVSTRSRKVFEGTKNSDEWVGA